MAHMTYTERAKNLAYLVHYGQEDKSGKPYYLHPWAVGAALEAEGFDAATVAAGYLHDVVEDTPIEIEMLSQFGFSEKTVSIVWSVTRDVDENNWRPETYKEFIQRVKTNPDAIPVKLADIAHNMSRLNTMRDQKEAEGLRKRFEWAIKELTE